MDGEAGQVQHPPRILDLALIEFVRGQAACLTHTRPRVMAVTVQ
jgi:hypothetical protein